MAAPVPGYRVSCHLHTPPLTCCFPPSQADANLGMEQLHFTKASLEYILKLQEVQERKKFEFVETVCPSRLLPVTGAHADSRFQILSFMYGWLTFYHQGISVGLLSPLTRHDADHRS